MYLLAPFNLQKFKRILWADPELSGCAIFSHEMAHLSWAIFFGTNHYYYFHVPVDPFYCAKYTTNSFGWSKVVRMPHFWTLNGPFSQNNFFWKIINIIFIQVLASFIVQSFKKILPVDPGLWGCAIFGHRIAHLPKL